PSERGARSGGVSHPFACVLSFAMRVESPLKSSPPAAAGPVQTVRPRVSPGCWPPRRVGAARGVARQRPGGSGAGGTAHKGRLNFLPAYPLLSAPIRQDKGPHPKPRWMPLPQLLYAQVVKTVRRRCLVRVRHRVVFGTLETVNAALAPFGWQINTAFVERLNLSMRQHVAAGGRRGRTRGEGEGGFQEP